MKLGESWDDSGKAPASAAQPTDDSIVPLPSMTSQPEHSDINTPPWLRAVLVP
jgi:hypothetical protein